MIECNSLSRSAAISCLMEMLASGATDPDCALQICQAMMNPKRRELILLATLCHEDNLDRMALDARECGHCRADCKSNQALTRCGPLPCD